MTLPKSSPLPHRGLIRVAGEDARSFLQNIISNDMTPVSQTQAIYATLLTPQGKFLHDMFVFEGEGGFLIDCEKDRGDDLLRRLSAYKMRAKVTFDNFLTSYFVSAVWDGTLSASLTFVDPRHEKLGQRCYTVTDDTPYNTTPTPFSDYERLRIRLGIADGSRDLDVERSPLSEGNIDLFNGVDWKKGCYVGQELTARMHYRALAKKRLFPFKFDGAVHSGSLIMSEGKEIGQVRSTLAPYGLALASSEDVKKIREGSIPATVGNHLISFLES